MKTIVIGDVHGRNYWQRILDRILWDKVIFIGDYWDSFNRSFGEQHENFEKIVHLKEEHPDQVVLLLGNHDFQYTPYALQVGDRYSGFQQAYAYTISHLLQLHKHLFQAAHLDGNYLFTHAGVTKTWLNSTMLAEPDAEIFFKGVALDEYINQVYTASPAYFTFTGSDPYGNDPKSGPFWVRPQSLNEDAVQGYTQVVGHTGVNAIGIEPVDFLESGRGWFIDCLDMGWYLVIEDGVARGEQVKLPKLTQWQRHKDV